MEHCLGPAAPPDKTAGGAISPRPLRAHNSLCRLSDNLLSSWVRDTGRLTSARAHRLFARYEVLQIIRQGYVNHLNFIFHIQQWKLKYRTLIPGFDKYSTAHRRANTWEVFKIQNNTNMAVLSGSKYLFSRDHQKKRKSHWYSVWVRGARRQKRKRVLSPSLSSTGAFWATQI